MYNGVGIQTARGSGTSGHVSRNLGALRPMRYDVKKLKEQREKQSTPREADPGIVHHNALRQIEVQLVTLRDKLEDQYVFFSNITHYFLEAYQMMQSNRRFLHVEKSFAKALTRHLSYQ